ncbi:hypothetical protein HMI54_006049 [Coelomomyces lativittatus]|nr:hypothetical protein HMI54_006049 [Coelomomyces lativittatus]
MIENINSKNSSELVSHPEQILDLDITILKEFFENLPMEQLHTISKAFQKHPNVISHLRNVSNLLTKVRFYFGESSIEKIESELKSNMKVINQFSSISNLFNLPMDKIGDKLQRFFICILAGLNHPQNTAYNIDEIQNFILNLSKSQASLDFIYESQKSLLKSPISSEVDIHAKVIESIALSGKLKQQLRIVFMKWKQSEIKLKELEVINETTPSFISLQKAWKEVVKGVGCQLTEDPQIVAKSLVQNLYNANSNLLQLSEQVNQANMKTDAIEWSYQEFRKRCKDVLRILSDSESDILQSIVDMQEDLRMKSKIDPSEHHLMKKLWDNFNRDFSSILNEEPLDASFSIEDQYKYWLHSIQCHLLARQQSSLNLVVLQKLHQSICQKIEVLGKQLPIKKLDLNNPSNILDEVAKNLLEFEKLSYRLSNLHQLVLPEMCNVDLNTKLDTIEKYLQELRNYREKYYQKRSNVSRMYPEKLGIPNLKELIGKVDTMPLITWKDSLSLKDPTYSAPMASLEKILNDTLGQTEKAINHYFNQLNKAEVKISAHINNSNLQQDNKNENEKKNLSSTLHDVHELGNVLEEALSMKEFTLENFERQRMLLLVKLKEYLKAITDSQCQAFVQLQANHEAESHKLKLDYGIQLNEKERDLRRLKKEISLLKNQLQALFNSKDTQAYSKALSTVLSKTLQTLDRV